MWKPKPLLLLLVFFLLTLPMPAASRGTGAVLEGNVWGASGIGSLNPLRCNNPYCSRIDSFLFPHLISVDPVSGTFVTQGDGLAAGWDIDGTVYTFHLRDDLTWSDGQPVTAYDVFYSYLAIASDEIDSPYTEVMNALVANAEPLDQSTIEFHLKLGNYCSALNILNIPVIPAHVFEPDFAAQAKTWQAEKGYFRSLLNSRFEIEPTVSAGVFEFESLHSLEYIRLRNEAGVQGFAYIDVPDRDTEIARFLAGDLNIIENPPFSRRADIRAARDVQIAEYPGLTWYAIALNLADPAHPSSAFDKHGNPVDQGHHPVLGDVQVRHAMQLAINMDDLIEAAVLGNGTPLAANQVPTSWALNSDLTPTAYDPAEARRLLEAAGWKDTNHNGIRECVGCSYAKPGTMLQITLLYEDSAVGYAAAQVIQQQLGWVGFSVSVTPTNGTPTDQGFDAFLTSFTESYPIDPGMQEFLFIQLGDSLRDGPNVGSYTNPRVEELYQQARTVPGCDVTERTGMYREIQAILQEDQPYIWLFAVNDMVAARGGVMGFAPYPNAPFWNVQDWTVIR